MTIVYELVSRVVSLHSTSAHKTCMHHNENISTFSYILLFNLHTFWFRKILVEQVTHSGTHLNSSYQKQVS